MCLVGNGAEASYGHGARAARGELVGPFIADAGGGGGVYFVCEGGVGDVEFVWVYTIVILIRLLFLEIWWCVGIGYMGMEEEMIYRTTGP
jgi:hypothetical protein